MSFLWVAILLFCCFDFLEGNKQRHWLNGLIAFVALIALVQVWLATPEKH
jgi:hypothetical protein